MMVCRVCGADSEDAVCTDCRQSSSAYGNGCAICDGFGGMPVNGTWTICPNCSQWDMDGQHYRYSNNRSVVMVDPEKFVQGVRRIRDLTEQRDALVARVEAAENVVSATQQWADDIGARGEWVPGTVLAALARFYEVVSDL
jgi:hypothetical protein